MKVLTEISEHSLGLGDTEKLGEQYELRKSARAIVLNADGHMATQYLTNYTYHKLPGGGVDPGETIAAAAKREVLEEVGCNITLGDALGMVIEYRNKYNLLHISYCYVAMIDGEIGPTALEEGEIEEGQETLWLPPSEVLEKMKADQPQKYEGYFILEREKAFLSEYLKLMG